MMRITIGMLGMMIHGDTGSPVANVERPMAAPELARLWLKAVARQKAMSRYYEARKSVRPRSSDELDHGGMLMVGGPARCFEQTQEIADAGANYIILSMNFAGLDQKVFWSPWR